MATPTDNNNQLTQMLEIAKQAAIKHLFVYYQEMSPTAIKVFLDCVSQATLITEDQKFCLSSRPSIRTLASNCNLSKATVQQGLKYLVGKGLLDNNSPTLMLLNKATKYFDYSLLGEQQVLSDGSENKKAPIKLVETAKGNVENTEVAAINKAPKPAFNHPSLNTLETKLKNKSDDDLILLYQNGVKDTFAEIYTRYFESVKAQISLKLPEEISYDIAQEIFLDLMEKLKYFQVNGQAKFSTWVYKFTKLFLANVQRKMGREVQLADDFDLKQIVRLTSPQKQILPYLFTLNETQQQCVFLHYYEGLSYLDVSEQLNIDKKTVRSYLQTARRHMRSVVDNQVPAQKPPKIKEKDVQFLYNKFFYSTLEKKVEETNQLGTSFIIGILSWKLSENIRQQPNYIEEDIASIIMNDIRSEDQAFNLGEQYFAIIFSNISKNTAYQMIEKIISTARKRLGIFVIVSCLMSEYNLKKSLKTTLKTFETKLQQKEDDTSTIIFID